MPALAKQRLGQLIDRISNITVGDAESRAKDGLGRVSESCLSQFASAEGKKDGAFYTPRCVGKLLVEMLEPFTGRVYDPCDGSSGMVVPSVECIRAHANGHGHGGHARSDISIDGQESNDTTWRLVRMNLASRGIDGQSAHGDSFHHDRFPDLKADDSLANPPFNVSDWRGDLRLLDQRWQYGVPPAGNANVARVQHLIDHLAPTGLAGFVRAHGSMSSNQSGEGEIRKHLVEADLVDGMVAQPGPRFDSTQIPACQRCLARDTSGKSPSSSLEQGWGGGRRFRDRRNQVLFSDARKRSRLVDRTHRELIDEEIARIADTYHAWRGTRSAPLLPGEGQGEGIGTVEYHDVPGFCNSASLEDIRKHGHVLTPGRYVGAEAQADDGEPLEQTMRRLTAQLREQQAEARRLDVAIEANLKGWGYGA